MNGMLRIRKYSIYLNLLLMTSIELFYFNLYKELLEN